jgi:DNA replication licensing factor MCM7
MALLTERSLVNYEEQEGRYSSPKPGATLRLTCWFAAAFVDFLQSFKSSSTEAAEQLEGLNLNGDGDSEYGPVAGCGRPHTNRGSHRSQRLGNCE